MGRSHPRPGTAPRVLLLALGWLLPLAASLAFAGGSSRVPPMPHPRVLGVADGLPASWVNDLDRDADGYVWIATSDGLARYDGIAFRHWRHDPADPGTLPGNYIAAVHVDPEDRLWVAVEGRGLAMLDSGSRAVRHVHPSVDVWTITSGDGALWYGTFANGVYRLRPADDGPGVPERFAGEASGLPDDTVLALAFDGAGTLWGGTVRGLARFDGTRFHPVVLPGGDPAPIIYSITPDEDGGLWVGARTGLYRRLADGRWQQPEWAPVFGPGNAVFSVLPDGDDGHWLATQRSLWHVPAGGDPYPVKIDADGPVQPLQQMLRQPDGALWFPVPGVGVGYLRADWRRMALLSRTRGGLSSELYRDVIPARDGGLWLLGRGHVERVGLDGQVHRLDPALQEQLRERQLLTVAEDARGRLWAGLSGSGQLLRLDPADGTLLEWDSDSRRDALPVGPVHHLVIAPDGTLWLSSAGAGLQQRDPDTGEVLLDLPRGERGLAGADLEALAFAPDGSLWVSGGDGIKRFDPAAERFERVPGLPSGDRVFGFVFSGPGELWLQRLSGLERYHWRQGHWQRGQHAGTASGIPPVEGTGLAVDPRGRVWLASMRGLYRWDPVARRARRFGISDGLSSQEFRDQGMVVDASGILGAALADGSVLLLDTEVDEPRASVPALAWDGLEVRRDGAWHALDPRAPRLHAGDRELRVRLSLLSFNDPGASRFLTWLEGHDSGWVEQVGHGERVLAGLPPGDHVLRARAIDAGGNAAVEQRLEFTLPPPWWRTPWALGGWTALAIAAAAVIARAGKARHRRRLRLRVAARERKLALRASEAKSRFLATLGHEVRTPMTGVLGMTELLLASPLDEVQRARAESIRGAGEHLLRLLDDALDLARIEAGRLQLDETAFEVRALVGSVAGLIAPLAARRGLEFRCHVDDAVPGWLCGDAVRVRQILLNLLGNAVKFTESGSVGLQVLPVAAGGIRMEVADTGPGLRPDQVLRLFRRFEQADGARTAARYGGSGLGLAICKELAAAMGGRIEVDTAPGRGTRFVVDLPLAAAPPAAPEPPGNVALPCPRPLSLLLVENDPVVAGVLAELLRTRGHRVTVAGHGLAALAEAAVLRFDAALLDLDLPGLDGVSLARHLRGQGFEAPLVAITARADAAAEAEALQAGFRRFLRKPVTGERLSRVLAEATAGEASVSAR